MTAIMCPACDHVFEDDPELAEGQTENHEVECPGCKQEVVYDLEFEPTAFNERLMPACRFSKHDYSETNCGHYLKLTCEHCGNVLIGAN